MTRTHILAPGAAALALLALLAGAAAARADPGDCGTASRCSAAVAKTSEHHPSARAAARVRARARAASGTILETCDDFHPPEALCGSVAVPLDRAHPGAGTIDVFFTIIPHSEPGPARGTILASTGGPRFSTTGEWEGFAFLVEPLLDRRDLLLIDLRGTGRSAAIDCPALQQGIGVEADATRACGEQLGAAASRFGTADRAEDIEAVRRALGIPKLDYYGLSNGGLAVQAYAVRYGNRLRTAILDSPYQAGFDDAFQSSTVDALLRATRLMCERSPTCTAADPRPPKTLRDLAARLRAQPVAGTAYDADGQPHTLVVDDTRLINLLSDDSAGYLSLSEVSAAARALERGDRLPLLRMAAETDFPEGFGALDDLRFDAVGDFYATFCTDGVWPWDATAAAEATRRVQYEAAVAGLPRGAFAPFSVPGWEQSLIPTGDLCVPWPQRVNVEPPVPAGARFPHVPTLVLSGDRDLLVPSERAAAVAASFPDAQFVQVANADHVVAFNSDCTLGLVREFIDSGGKVDARCAAEFTPTYAVTKFARRAAFAPAPPVDRSGGDRSRPLDRRVAGAAWSAAYDGIQHSFRMDGDSGLGLRGGTFAVEGTDTGFALVYDRARFTEDVAISGRAEIDFANGGLVDAELLVDGPSDRDGSLRATGQLFPHLGPVTGRGKIGGRRVAVLLPST